MVLYKKLDAIIKRLRIMEASKAHIVTTDLHFTLNEAVEANVKLRSMQIYAQELSRTMDLLDQAVKDYDNFITGIVAKPENQEVTASEETFYPEFH